MICGMACVSYVYKTDTPFGNARRYYYVEEFAVDANYRKQGIGKELFEFMLADAKKRNINKIELNVWKFNDSAIEFYQAAGFKMMQCRMAYEVK